jgi:IS30 family transposase
VQISNSLALLYPNDKHMQISHESIYTYVYLLGRGELKKELTEGLRQRKKTRYSRKTAYDKRGRITDMISIEERPAEVADRSIAGHWEGDLIIGKGHKSALGVIVERKTRAVILVPLAAKDAYSVREAFEKELSSLPVQMKRSMTYDNGSEMKQHKLFTANTKMQVYFCHPNSPWERGTCENTNGLIRQYFPKGTDFSKVTVEEIKTAQHQLNERPRKTLNWKTPKDVFENEILLNCT